MAKNLKVQSWLRMPIQITTKKILPTLSWGKPNFCWKFQSNMSSVFFVILLTDEKQQQSHNLAKDNEPIHSQIVCYSQLFNGAEWSPEISSTHIQIPVLCTCNNTTNTQYDKRYEASLATWDRRVNWHPIQMNILVPCMIPQPSRPVLDLPTLQGRKAELTLEAGYMPSWFTCLQSVTQPSNNRMTSAAWHGVKLETFWSQVEHTNRYATKPLT